MPTNEILQFGTGGTVEDGDVLDLTVYEADPDRVGGVQPGIARRALFNTVMRQVTLISAGVAEFIANRYEDGVVDDGDLAKIEAGLAAAISGMITAALPGQATTEGQGLVELATTSEAEAGADTTRAVTPAGLAAALAGLSPEAATTSAQGVVELATTAEAEAGTDATRAVTPTGLAAAILAAAPSAATTALLGLVELATTAEAAAGTDTTRAVTPAGLAAALVDDVLHVQDQKAASTSGGAFTAGAWQTRTLNTVVSNSISGASLSNNRITLPAGTYVVFAQAPAFHVNEHQTQLYNATNGTTLLLGTVEFSNAGSNYASNPSVIMGVLTLTSTKELEIQHQCTTSYTSEYAMGRPVSWGTCVYTQVLVHKVK